MKKSLIIILLGILILLLFSNCWLYIPETEDIRGIADILYDGDYIAICRLSYKENGGWVYFGDETTESIVGIFVQIIDVNTDEVYSEYLDASGETVPYGEYAFPSYIRKSDKNIYFLSWYLSNNYKYSLENKTTLKPVKDTLFDNVENFFISPDETEVIIIVSGHLFQYFNRTTGETKEFNAGQGCKDVNWDLGLTAEISNESNVYIESFRTDSIICDVVELDISSVSRLKWFNDALLVGNYNSMCKLEKIDTTWQQTGGIEEKYYYMADDSSYINIEAGMINIYDKNDNLIKEYEL